MERNDEKAGWRRVTEVTPLTAEQVACIVGRAFPGRRVARWEPIGGGLSNSNHRLEVEGLAESFVIRLHTRDPAMCRKEVELHALVGAAVPVAQIVDADPGGECGIGPYLLMRWVDGSLLRDIKAGGDPAATAACAASVGATLAAIHRFQFAHAGPIGPDLTIGPPFVEGPDPLLTFTETCLAAPALQERLSAEERDRIRALTAARSPALAVLEEERSLVHCDFNAANILVSQDAGRWLVAAVLDWEFALSGSKYFDLANFLRYESATSPRFEPHFSRAYAGAGGVLPEGWREIARAVDLTALLEILTRPGLPAPVVAEVRGLVLATVDGAPG